MWNLLSLVFGAAQFSNRLAADDTVENPHYGGRDTMLNGPPLSYDVGGSRRTLESAWRSRSRQCEGSIRGLGGELRYQGWQF